MNWHDNNIMHALLLCTQHVDLISSSCVEWTRLHGLSFVGSLGKFMWAPPSQMKWKDWGVSTMATRDCPALPSAAIFYCNPHNERISCLSPYQSHVSSIQQAKQHHGEKIHVSADQRTTQLTWSSKWKHYSLWHGWKRTFQINNGRFNAIEHYMNITW